MPNYQGNRPQGAWKGGGDRKFGGGGSFNRGSDRGGFDRPQLHQATCAKCNNSCEVPFKPDGSRPIYCRDCFKKDDAGPTQRFERQDSRGFNLEEKRMFQATCDKCNNSCEVPFRPTGAKPVYCRDCFKKDGDSSSAPRFERRSAPEFRGPAPESRSNDQHADQFRALNVKLDMIIKAMNLSAPAKTVAAEPKKAETAVVAPKAEKAVVVEKTVKAEKAVKAPAKKAAAKKKK